MSEKDVRAGDTYVELGIRSNIEAAGQVSETGKPPQTAFAAVSSEWPGNCPVSRYTLKRSGLTAKLEICPQWVL